MGLGIVVGTSSQICVGSQIVQNITLSSGEGNVCQSKGTGSFAGIIVDTEALPAFCGGAGVLKAEGNPAVSSSADGNISAVNGELSTADGIYLVVASDGNSHAGADLVCISQHEASLMNACRGGNSHSALGGVDGFLGGNINGINNDGSSGVILGVAAIGAHQVPQAHLVKAMGLGVAVSAGRQRGVGSHVVHDLTLRVGEGDVCHSESTGSFAVIAVDTEALPVLASGGSVIKAESNPTVSSGISGNRGATNAEAGATKGINLIVAGDGDGLVGGHLVGISQHQASLMNACRGSNGHSALGGVGCAGSHGQTAQHSDQRDQNCQSSKQGNAFFHMRSPLHNIFPVPAPLPGRFLRITG